MTAVLIPKHLLGEIGSNQTCHNIFHIDIKLRTGVVVRGLAAIDGVAIMCYYSDLHKIDAKRRGLQFLEEDIIDVWEHKRSFFCF